MPFDELTAYRVTEIPRCADPAAPGGGRGERDPGRAQRAAALLAAYHAGVAAAETGLAQAGGAVLFGWVRTATGGPVRVIAAGAALAGSTTDGREAAASGEVLLALPGGARGRPLPPGQLAALLGELGCWRPVAGISDPLLTAGGEAGEVGLPGNRGSAGRPGAPCLEDVLLGSWTGPFGWLVLAQPLVPAELRVLAAETGSRQRFAEGMADRFPERAVEGRRLKERHAELQRGLSAGFWRITIAAGGPDAAGAARVAGLLCASADLDGLPYALTPAPPCPPGGGVPASGAVPVRSGFAASGGMAGPGGDAEPAAPFHGSTELLAALARPPESEVPGVRLALRPEFDVTPEWGRGRGGIELGDVLDRNLLPAGPFALAADSLNRHVFVCGATGSGKSQTVRSLLEAATRQGIPWLVVEPAKAEYRLMAARLPDAAVIRIRPGEPDAVAAGLNPLEPAAGEDGARFPLQTHADLVRALFIASFRSEEPFPQVLSAALTRVYTEAGWDLALGEPARPGARYPALTDLQRVAEAVVTDIGYSQRVTDDVLGFIRVRLASLRLGTTGRFLEGGHPIDFGALMRANAVLEIEDVGDDSDKAFLMGAVLIRLAEHLRLTHRTAGPAAGTLRHLTVIEEAHRLLRRPAAEAPGGGGAAGHAVELFAGLLAEIRAYGEGLVIAEQIPARLLPDVIKNTAVKIVHRLPAADDREAVGATMNATPAQSRFLVTLTPGQAAAAADGMDFPVLVKIRNGMERERLTPGRTRDPGGVVSPRSPSCGTGCAAGPCTLRELRAAQRSLDDYGWVRLWADLGVLAHLTGWPMPAPKPEPLARFRALPRRTADCAVSHAVDAAVAVRPAVPDPDALAAHVTAAIRAQLDGTGWRCPAVEPEWLVTAPVTVEAGGPLAELLVDFVDCDWPLSYVSRAC